MLNFNSDTKCKIQDWIDGISVNYEKKFPMSNAQCRFHPSNFHVLVLQNLKLTSLLMNYLFEVSCWQQHTPTHTSSLC